VTKSKPAITVRLIRPIDCSPKLLRALSKLLLTHTDVQEAHLRQGFAGVERVTVAIADQKALVGTACLKYQNSKYHKYLFKQAGVPQMYNPDSLESAWLCVHPEYRRLGIWNKMHVLRKTYLGNRPYHSTHRVENNQVVERTKQRGDYRQAGKHFQSINGDHMLRLVVANHDDVYDPSKGLVYGNRINRGIS
jgi:GNAT superfamily N-acetyltransferase